MQHNPHHHSDHHHEDKRHWHMKQTARRQALQALEAAGAAKSLGLVARDEAREAAIEQEATQGDDEWLNTNSSHQYAVQQAEAAGNCDHGQNGQGPRERPLRQHDRKHNSQERKDRSDREIYTTGNDDHADPDAEDAVHSDQPRHVLQIRRREKSRIENGHDDAEHHEQGEDAKFFSHFLLIHYGARASLPA
jgi:hypothetical protein